MAVDRAKIAKRIKAILAKARSTGYDGEAAVFMAKAEKLMQEHGISVLEAETADNPIGEEKAMAVSGIWQRRLVHALAQFYGCSTLYESEGGKRFRMFLFGTDTGRAMACEMWPYVKQAVGRQASRAVTENAVRLPREKIKEHIGNALVIRIYEMIQARKEATPVSGESNALVIVDQVQAFIHAAYPDLKAPRKSRFETSGMARQYADKIGLDNQVNGEGGGPLLLE